MAELGLSVFAHQCLDQRIPSAELLRELTGRYATRRNHERATISWQFTTDQAHVKLRRLHPSNSIVANV